MSRPEYRDTADLLAELHAAAIAADLRGVRLRADEGRLADDELRWILGVLGSYCWTALDPVNATTSVKLSPAQHRELKAVAAHAIHRQHGGRFVDKAGKMAWVSDDGFYLKGVML